MLIRSVREVVAGRALPRVEVGTTVRAAAHILDDFNVGALLVMEGETLVGVLSERDIIRRCIAHDDDPQHTRVETVMTPDPHVVQADTALNDALAVMVQGRFRHMPVLDGARVIALLSIRDIPTEYRLMYERFVEARTSKAG